MGTMPVLNLTAQPVINSFSPLAGPVGGTVIISGSNFSSIPAENIVYFGAVKATVTTAVTNSLSVTVPGGSSYQPITVTVNGLTGFSARGFNPTFTRLETNLSAFTYNKKTDLATGNYPADIAVADYDGDGLPDVATANSGLNNTFSVIRNTNTTPKVVSFANKVDFSTNQGPLTVTTGDMDGDGKPDIAVCNSNAAGQISIFRNTSVPGTVSFAAKIDIYTGISCSDAFIRDLDGDGKSELLVIRNSVDRLIVFKNSSTPGNILFNSPVEYVTGQVPAKIAVADLDGDGRPDVAVSNSTGNTISIFKNNGTGLDPKVDFPAANSPAWIAIADLDFDNKPDLAVANYSSNSMSVFRNASSPGNISLAAKTDFPVVFSPLGICINDLNGDGKVDIAVANYGQPVSVFQNNSTPGNLILSPKIEYTASGGGYSYIGSADLDNDNKPDLAVANASSFVSILRNRLSEPNITSFSALFLQVPIQ